MQHSKFLIVGILLSLFAYGCGIEPDGERSTHPQIQVQMAPALAQQAPVSVQISVTDAEGSHTYDNPARLSERAFNFDIEVLSGDVEIAIRLTYEDGTVITHTEQVEVTPEQNIININLNPPNWLAVGIDSDASFPVRRNGTFPISLYIQNVQDLYGMAVRLHFDEQFISPVEITPGAFWGVENTDFTWIEDLQTHQENELNIAWTRLASSLNSQDKAILAQVKFKAKQPTGDQPTMIGFVVDDSTFLIDGKPRAVFRIQNRDGGDVSGFSRLKAIVAEREYPIDIR